MSAPRFWPPFTAASPANDVRTRWHAHQDGRCGPSCPWCAPDAAGLVTAESPVILMPLCGFQWGPDGWGPTVVPDYRSSRTESGR